MSSSGLVSCVTAAGAEDAAASAPVKKQQTLRSSWTHRTAEAHLQTLCVDSDISPLECWETQLAAFPN